jgi:hypothetical protein
MIALASPRHGDGLQRLQPGVVEPLPATLDEGAVLESHLAPL